MISRRKQNLVVGLLASSSAVVLLGPRQSGKTTLARAIGNGRPSTYFDLESDRDRARLTDVEEALSRLAGNLVILDEVQRLPGLFQPLRGLIDEGRRAGRRTGQYLLLGSASIDLLQQAGETLAGRIAIVELGPFDILELGASQQDRLWVRGGFPDSVLAKDDRESLRWRRDFIRTYLERDVPQLGLRIPAEALRRFWTMLAHRQGALLNAAELARSLEVDGKTIARYVDLLVDLLLVRRLPPVHGNAGKRLVKSPKLYIRDSGLVHALLGIDTLDTLLSHPVAGGSFEGCVVEQLLSAAPDGTSAGFYRSVAGAEIDLVLQLPGAETWAIEIKRGLSPKLGRGFHSARADIAPARSFVVYGGTERYPLAADIEAVPLHALAAELAARA
ncbi:MAG: ATP-binding protein [Hyphomicrobiaceae bacterium]|nr:ATP-binding protein [Hyphomicrobiaceae bacterium]